MDHERPNKMEPTHTFPSCLQLQYFEAKHDLWAPSKTAFIPDAHTLLIVVQVVDWVTLKEGQIVLSWRLTHIGT